MNDESDVPLGQDAIEAAAAAWVVRQDRGLTAAEQDELSAWIAADSRHGPALGACRWGWEELDRLAGIQTSVRAVPDPDLLARKKGAFEARLSRVLLPALCAVAVAGIIFFAARDRFISPAAQPAPVMAFSWLNLSNPCERRTLEDGSVVDLNRGAELKVSFTAAERRVELVRGEAHFTVTKNPQRPFIVTAQGVEARAVGTAFNVKVDAAAIEVLVTEGRVKVDAAPSESSREGDTPTAPVPVVEVGQRATVALTPGVRPHAEVVTLTAAQMDETLAWQPRLLDFNNRPLPEIVAAFNQHNLVHLVVADPSLNSLKLSAAVRSDNVAGFVRLIEADFGVRAEWRGDNRIFLSRAK